MREAFIRQATARAQDGQLSCQAAMALADEMGVAPIEIGKAVNRATDLRFYRCQLGLFGYGSKAEGRHKIVQAAQIVPDDVRKALEMRAKEGRIACKAIWEVAEAFGYPRLGVSNIVDAMGYKITPCQLGCF